VKGHEGGSDIIRVQNLRKGQLNRHTRIPSYRYRYRYRPATTTRNTDTQWSRRSVDYHTGEDFQGSGPQNFAPNFPLFRVSWTRCGVRDNAACGSSKSADCLAAILPKRRGFRGCSRGYDPFQSMETDALRRAAEHEALHAIYADALEGDAAGPWIIDLGVNGAILECFLPDDYPSTSPPTPVLHIPALSDDERAALVAEITWLFDGCEVVYSWAEHLREALTERAESEAAEAAAVAAVADADQQIDQLSSAMADASGFTFMPATNRYGQRVRHFGAESIDPSFAVEVTSGASFHPPKSGPSEEFQAHVATVTSMGHVKWALARLLSDKRIARATHNMLAYRYVDERGVQVSDNDDDGESSSGTKLAALLELANVNNVLVVVSRWFGGVLLGPVRFKYIASTARALLEETGRCTSGPGGGDGGKGKGKKR
jgi:hypothetical protein